MEKASPKFDSSKNYQWTPEDSFELGGQEFSFLLQFFSREVHTTEGNTVLDKMKAYTMFQEMLKLAVEQGVAKEVETINNADVLESEEVQ
jgi:hypothetical protein